MPTSTINATYQGRVILNVSNFFVNWLSQVRNATTGSLASTYTTNTTVTDAFKVEYNSSRGFETGQCARVPLFFDVSSITASNTITAATLKVWNPSAGSATDNIIVKGSAWGGDGSTTTLSTANYNDLDFSTAYSSKNLSWAGSGAYNDFTMNATAISDMNTNGYLNCFLIEGDFDYDGQNPVLDDGPYGGTVEYLDATNKIKLELTYSPSGYGNNVIGVASANIGDVIGVAKANIDNIIGV
jgi:hypothetical protein